MTTKEPTLQDALEMLTAHIGECRAQQAAIEWALVMFLPLLTAGMPEEIASSFLGSIRRMYPNGARDVFERAAEAHANRLIDRVEAARKEFSAKVPTNLTS